MIVAFSAASIISCQKECVCEKTYTSDVNLSDTIPAQTVTTTYSEKGYDKRECESLSYEETDSAYSTKFTCSLQ